jgi:hypothetical protein
MEQHNVNDLAELTAIAGRAKHAIYSAIERELQSMDAEIDRFLRSRLAEAQKPTDEHRLKTKLKFGPLFEFFRSHTSKEFTLTFAELGEIIGEPLCGSAYKYRDYWSRYGRSRLADCWYSNGYKIKKLDLEGQKVTFYRISPFGMKPENSGEAD